MTRKYLEPEFDRDCEIIANNIRRDNTKYDVIVALGRGGIPAGTRLGNLLNIPVEVVQYSLKDDTRAARMLDFVNRFSLNTRFLIVDDISDSGTTLQEIAAFFDGTVFHTATLVFKPQTSRYRPTYLATIHMGDAWVEFFWEEPLIAK